MSIRVAGRGGFARSQMVKIYEETLAAVGRFDVTNIPPGFTDLVVRALVRSDVAATSDSLSVYFNGDTTNANYRRGSSTGGTSVADGGADDSFVSLIGNSAIANNFAINDILIPFYSRTNLTKSFLAISGFRRTTTEVLTTHAIINWESTDAINQITLQPDGYPTDELLANSNLLIFGIY